MMWLFMCEGSRVALSRHVLNTPHFFLTSQIQDVHRTIAKNHIATIAIIFIAIILE